MNIKNKITILTNELANLKSKFATKLEAQEKWACENFLSLSGIDNYPREGLNWSYTGGAIVNKWGQVNEKLKKFEKIKENVNYISNGLDAKLEWFEKLISMSSNSWDMRNRLQSQIDKYQELREFFRTVH